MYILIKRIDLSFIYSVVVKAFNGAGVGRQTPDLHVKTLEGDVPPPPRVGLLLLLLFVTNTVPLGSISTRIP